MPAQLPRQYRLFFAQPAPTKASASQCRRCSKLHSVCLYLSHESRNLVICNKARIRQYWFCPIRFCKIATVHQRKIQVRGDLVLALKTICPCARPDFLNDLEQSLRSSIFKERRKPPPCILGQQVIRPAKSVLRQSFVLLRSDSHRSCNCNAPFCCPRRYWISSHSNVCLTESAKGYPSIMFAHQRSRAAAVRDLATLLKAHRQASKRLSNVMQCGGRSSRRLMPRRQYFVL